VPEQVIRKIFIMVRKFFFILFGKYVMLLLYQTFQKYKMKNLKELP